jgi:hypothetical protein
MTTDNDLILAALSFDAPSTRSELEETTGLEAKTLSNRLFALHTKGLIGKNPNGPGWLLASGPPAAKANTVTAREPVAEAPAPVKRGPKPKAAKVPKRLPPPASSVPHANGRACEFAIAESGAILFKITSGPRAGELGEIGCADAMALYRLMSAVEFIA